MIRVEFSLSKHSNSYRAMVIDNKKIIGYYILPTPEDLSDAVIRLLIANHQMERDLKCTWDALIPNDPNIDLVLTLDDTDVPHTKKRYNPEEMLRILSAKYGID
jgi:hypothetical protein